MSIKYICVILQKYAKVPLTVLFKKKKSYFQSIHSGF